MQLQHRQQITFIGTLVGAALGALVALLWLDYATDGDENVQEKVSKIGLGDVARIGTAIFAIARQLNALASEVDEDM